MKIIGGFMKFEYITKFYKIGWFIILDEKFNKFLNDLAIELAKDNWVLDQVTSVDDRSFGTSRIVLIFKRPLS